MPDLSFEVISAQPARDAIAPALVFDLRITNKPPEEAIHAVVLRCQIQIEVARRRYSSAEQDQLRELFDDPKRWGDTLRPITWVNTSVNIPPFTGTTITPVAVPCTLDFSMATTKYFHALGGEDIPLTFLFSGSVFYAAANGLLQVAPLSWNTEARFRFPIDVWKAAMDLHFPNAACLHLRRDVFNELYRFKAERGLATFEEAIEQMLAIAGREQPV